MYSITRSPENTSQAPGCVTSPEHPCGHGWPWGEVAPCSWAANDPPGLHSARFLSRRPVACVAARISDLANAGENPVPALVTAKLTRDTAKVCFRIMKVRRAAGLRLSGKGCQVETNCEDPLTCGSWTVNGDTVLEAFHLSRDPTIRLILRLHSHDAFRTVVRVVLARSTHVVSYDRTYDKWDPHAI
jgi:hypothetical protein